MLNLKAWAQRLTCFAVEIWEKYTPSSKRLLHIQKSKIGMIDDGMSRVLSHSNIPN